MEDESLSLKKTYSHWLIPLPPHSRNLSIPGNMHTHHFISSVSVPYLTTESSRTSLRAQRTIEGASIFYLYAFFIARNNVTCSLLLEDSFKKEKQTVGIVYFYDCIQERHGVRFRLRCIVHSFYFPRA